jgi:hypothetical protein
MAYHKTGPVASATKKSDRQSTEGKQTEKSKQHTQTLTFST